MESDKVPRNARRAEAICNQLHRAYRDLRFYPPDHPVATETTRQLVDTLSHYLSDEDSLALEVDEDSLTFEGETVYAHAETRDNLAFLMFRDGVRAVSFQLGAEAAEIEAFVECLAHADDLVGSDQDLITSFWQRDFSHIDYEAADPFQAGAVLREGTLDALRETVLRRLDEALVPGDHEGPIPLTRLDIVAPLATDLEALVLRPEELEESARRARGTTSLLEDFAEVLLEILSDPAYGSIEHKLIQSLASLVQSCLKTHNLAATISLLEHLRTLEERGLIEAQVAESVVSEAWEDECVRTIALSLGRRGADELADLERFLDSVRLWTHRPLLWLLAETSDRRVRKMIVRLLQKDGSAPARELEPLLKDPRWYVTRNALQLAASSRDAALTPLVERLASHRDERVRREAIRALEVLGGGTARTLFVKALDDEDSGVRVAAARGLVRHKGGESETAALFRQVARRDFESRSAREVEAVLLALAGQAGEAALPVLDRLRRRSWFRSRPRAVRIAALAALGAIPSASARTLLEEGARSGDRALQQAARQALQGRQP